MIDNKTKRKLKGLASLDKTNYQIGKQGLTQTALAMLDNALNARELIKITVNQSVHDDIVKFMLDLSAKLHAEIVEKKGFTIVLYRKNPKKDILKL